MTSSVSMVVSGLAGVLGTGGAAAVGVAMLRRPRPYLPGSHALLDPGRRGPLSAALRRGFAGASVPTRLGPSGVLSVGSGAPTAGRTLGRLVLDPLAERARRRSGRVHHGTVAPFALVVEVLGLEHDDAGLCQALRALDDEISTYTGMFTRFVDGRVTPGAVTVVVAGPPAVRDLLAEQPYPQLFADGTFDDLDRADAPSGLVPIISEHWSWRFGWDGLEAIPAEERHLLYGLVRAAHADGRTVRIFGVPSRPRRVRAEFWSELTAAGVDLIGSAEVAALARHLRSHPPMALMPSAEALRTP